MKQKYKHRSQNALLKNYNKNMKYIRNNFLSKFIHVHLYVTIELMLKSCFLNIIWIFMRSYMIIAKIENANP